jgi:hypothetical protein
MQRLGNGRSGASFAENSRKIGATEDAEQGVVALNSSR